jgi:hypothetical protein
MRLRSLGLFAFAAATLALAGPASADLSGAIWVGYSDGVEVNGNEFTDRQDVYVNGSGLAEGEYYVRVTDTLDNVVRGTSIGTANERPFVVGADGKPVSIYQLWSLVVKTSDGTPGYDKPAGTWCEYRVWISTSSGFESETCLLDIFIVKEQPKKGTVNVCKFYDADANGAWDEGEDAIEGWKVFVTAPDGSVTSVFTPATLQLSPGTYSFTEANSVIGSWTATTATTVTVDLEAGEEVKVTFGNVCTGSSGGLTPGFWSNKNGQALVDSGDLAALVALHLVDEKGNAFDPTSASNLAGWLKARNAKNMACQLSGHLAAMTLNVRNGFVPGDALLFVGSAGDTGPGNQYIAIGDLLADAEAALAADGYTPTGDPNRAAQETLKNLLDAANNSATFLTSGQTAFGF